MRPVGFDFEIVILEGTMNQWLMTSATKIEDYNYKLYNIKK